MANRSNKTDSSTPNEIIDADLPHDETIALLHQALIASEKRAETLAALAAVTSSTRDPNVLAQRAVDLVKAVTNAAGAFIYKWDPQTERLVLRVATEGRQKRFIDKISLLLGEGVTGWSALMRRSVFIENKPLEDPRFRKFAELEEDEFKSVLAVPIMVAGGEVAGVFSLYSNEKGAFQDQHVGLVEEVGHLLANAMEQADTVENLQKQADVARILKSLKHDAFTSESELAQTLVDRARRQLNLEFCSIEFLTAEKADNSQAFAVSSATAPEFGSTQDHGKLLTRKAFHAVIDRETAGLEKVVRTLALGDNPPAGVLTCWRQSQFTHEDNQLIDVVAVQLGLALSGVSNLKSAPSLFTMLRFANDKEWAFRQAVEAGWRPQGSYFPVVAQVSYISSSPQRFMSETTRQILSDTFSSLDAFIIPTCEPMLAMLVPAEPGKNRVPEAFDLKLREFSQDVNVSLAVGVGTKITEDAIDLPGALTTAYESSEWAQLRKIESVIVYQDEIALNSEIVQVFEEMSESLVDLLRRFAKVVEYDKQHATELTATLDMYISSRGSIANTASALFVHRNTLRQRLERIETIIGFSVDYEEDWLLPALAVRLLKRKLS